MTDRYAMDEHRRLTDLSVTRMTHRCAPRRWRRHQCRPWMLGTAFTADAMRETRPERAARCRRRSAGRRRRPRRGDRRRAIRRMATWRPTPRWSRPRPRASRRRNSPPPSSSACAQTPGDRRSRRRRPRLRQSPPATRRRCARVLPAILRAGEAYGDSDIGSGTRVNVEYVSANPTGPMHIGHCRGAVVGDALANLLAKAGYAVTKEYYINDAGAQVTALAWAAYWRYLQAIGTPLTRSGFRRRSARRPAIPRRLSGPGRRATGANNTAPRSRSRTATSPRRKSGSTSCATSPSTR